MNFQAAVLTELGKPLSIQNVSLDDLAATDVLVKIQASGLCHTELEILRGDIPVPAPMAMGHEGAGIVDAVGASVTRVKPGDHVVCSWNPSCGHCFYCVRDQPILCETIGPHAGKGGMPDGTFRLNLYGQRLHQFSYVASHAEYTVISEAGAIPIPREMPLDRACLLGCGVMTGVGAALNIARVRVGSSAVTLGCGIVGLSAIQGARLGGAEINIAVDVNEDRLQFARRIGATHTINAAVGDGIEQVRALTQKRGADYSFEAAGNQTTMQNALEMTRTGGTVVILGKVPFQRDVSFRFGSIFGEKIITRSSYGGARPMRDFPMLSRLYLQGDLLLDDLISEHIPLEGIPAAFEQMASGQILRAVVSL
jgi:S-(hydroxymethyl)glutathione dehydrogenase/alcohol dehydrogenase